MKAALLKMKFTDERQKGRWLSAMQRDIMSSEDSEVEAGDETVVVRKLPRRNDQVSTLMKQVDAKLKIDCVHKLHGRQKEGFIEEH